MHVTEPESQSPSGLRATDVTVRFGGLIALDKISTSFGSSGLTGLIGPNGAGKTTLFNALTGFVKVDEGEVEFGDVSITNLTPNAISTVGIVRSFQTVRLMEAETVFDNILVGRYRVRKTGSLRDLFRTPKARAQTVEDHERTLAMADMLGFEATDLKRRLDELPFGMQRMVEIGRVLVSEPLFALLDEPAAGLTARERSMLVDFLRSIAVLERTRIVLTEHDVDLVRDVCRHVTVLDSGSVLIEGEPDLVLADPRVRTAYFGEQPGA